MGVAAGLGDVLSGRMDEGSLPPLTSLGRDITRWPTCRGLRHDARMDIKGEGSVDIISGRQDPDAESSDCCAPCRTGSASEESLKE